MRADLHACILAIGAVLTRESAIEVIELEAAPVVIERHEQLVAADAYRPTKPKSPWPGKSVNRNEYTFQRPSIDPIPAAVLTDEDEAERNASVVFSLR